MNHAYIFICGFLLPKHYRKKITISKYWICVHGLQQTLSKDICTAAKLGERRLFKVALPEAARNHYISFWLSGRALDSGQAERQEYAAVSLLFFFCFFVLLTPSMLVQIPLSLLFCSCFFLMYCCTAVVVLLNIHGGFVGSCWWMVFSAVYCALLLYHTTYCCSKAVSYTHLTLPTIYSV